MAGPPPQADLAESGLPRPRHHPAGLPPFSGFVGKLMLLTTLREVSAGPASGSVLLAAGFLVMIALARDGCYLVWKHRQQPGQERQPRRSPGKGRPPPAAGRRRPLAGSRRAPAVRLR
jgi:hypothetical protein